MPCRYVTVCLNEKFPSTPDRLSAESRRRNDELCSCKDMLSHSIQNKEYHLSVFHLCFRESHRLKIVQLYSLKMSVSGNYGSAIKMMGKDKRQLI